MPCCEFRGAVSFERLVCGVLALGSRRLATDAGRASAAESYAIAMHGAPALPADFTHMPYANPDAPKGGRLVQGMLGTFDSLNPLIVRGLAVQQIRGFVVESLMARGNDEPSRSMACWQRAVETDDARSYVTFHLDPKARFSDGQPVLAEDVLFSWALLRDKGRPNHRQYYSKVAKAEALGPAHGAVRSWRRQRPRTAADPRPDAGTAQARRRCRDFRGNHDDARRSVPAPTASAR